MNTLEPRLIEPGYLKRWLHRGLTIVGINFHLWFALALSFSALCWVFEGWPAIQMPLGVAFCYFSIEMAALSTRRLTTLRATSDSLRRAAVEAALEMWHQRLRLLLIFISVMVVQVLAALFVFKLAPATAQELVSKAPPDYSDIRTWLFTASPFASAAMAHFLSGIVIDRGQAFGFVRYPLRRAFELPDELAEFLRLKAYRKNQSAALNANLFEMTVLLLSLVALPILAPFLLCLLPAMHYVVFKELFDPEGLPALQEQSLSVPATLAKANAGS